jgi:hypothetical protein
MVGWNENRYKGWAVLRTGPGVSEVFVARCRSEAEARALVRRANQTRPELHWAEWWSTASILSSVAGGVLVETANGQA